MPKIGVSAIIAAVTTACGLFLAPALADAQPSAPSNAPEPELSHPTPTGGIDLRIQDEVFLSYASQDAPAALRIAEALCSAGIEVWFDQSALRGGDVWDQTIRREIHDCALFMPVISANTASRHEGYFRLEWDLADQRTHMMARSRVFVVPVCLDVTTEAAADVPDSFKRVQWTRLSGGEPNPAFVERIQRDPARDKPELIGRYAEAFHPRFAALSGSEAQTRKVATAYKVYFEKVPVRGTNQYAIDHTSFTYVLDAEGRFAGFFPPGTSGERIAERVRAMLSTR